MRVTLTIKPGGYFVTLPQVIGLSDADVECIEKRNHPQKERVEFVIMQAAITLNNCTMRGSC